MSPIRSLCASDQICEGDADVGLSYLVRPGWTDSELKSDHSDGLGLYFRLLWSKSDCLEQPGGVPEVSEVVTCVRFVPYAYLEFHAQSNCGLRLLGRDLVP